MGEPIHFEMDPDFSARNSPKKIGRAAIKCVRKLMKLDARKLKECAGCLISVDDPSKELDQCKRILENFYKSLKTVTEEDSIFGTECAMVPNMEVPVRFMEIKHGSAVGYKDVKLIFQAQINGKFYNFEVIFLLEKLRKARSVSHVFYEFTRQFGVHKGLKTMDHVLQSFIESGDTLSKLSPIEKVMELHRRTTLILEHGKSLQQPKARRRRQAFHGKLHTYMGSRSESSEPDEMHDTTENSSTSPSHSSSPSSEVVPETRKRMI